jgi:hypothetical protein
MGAIQKSAEINANINALKLMISGEIGLRNIHKARTLPIAIEAMEKQIPMQVDYGNEEEPHCRRCEFNLGDYLELPKWCPDCGQALKEAD